MVCFIRCHLLKYLSIHVYIPRTQMTLILIGKGLVLEGWPSKIGVSWVLGIYIPWVKVGGTLTMHWFIMFIFPPCKKTYLLGMVGRLAMYFDHRGYRIKACGSTSHPASEKWRVCSIENPRTKKSWNVTLTEYRDSYRQRWSIPRYTSIRIWF